MRFGLALALASLLAGCYTPEPTSLAEPVGRFHWTDSVPWFGGFSAVAMSDDGAILWALSDGGWLTRVALRRDGPAIAGAEIRQYWRLKTTDEDLLTGHRGDAEGLARTPDGTLFVSFEFEHFLRRYDDPSAAATWQTKPPNTRILGRNKSFESLARDADGVLYVIPEHPRVDHRGFPVYAFDRGTWRFAFGLPRRNGYLATSAEFGPDGKFYLLERRLRPIGFQSRLRRWTIQAGSPTDETLVLETEVGAHDNLEGMSLWQDAAGRLRLTLISDDNKFSLQKTEIVEFILTE